MAVKPKIPDHVTVQKFTDLRIAVLGVFEDILGMATLLREGSEILENGEQAVASAQSCAAECADIVSDAVNKLRAIALKCEELQ